MIRKNRGTSCFVSAKFGPLMIFPERWIAYNKTKQKDIYECQDALCEKAIKHYEKFLHLWKNVDLSFLEIEDAKKKLAGLKNQ